MLPLTKKSLPQVSRRVNLLLVALAGCAVAVPTVHLSRVPRAAAEETTAQISQVEAGGGTPLEELPPEAEFLPPLSPQERRIEALLDTPRDWDLSKQSFNSLMRRLGEESRITIVNIAEIGDEADGRMLYSITLRTLLRLLDLGYDVKEGILFIDQGYEETQSIEDAFTRTYPVADLLTDPEKSDHDQSSTVNEQSLENLKETIAITISVESWERNRGDGGIGKISIVPASACLVITQKRSEHHEVLVLLRSLRAARRIAANRASPETIRK